MSSVFITFFMSMILAYSFLKSAKQISCFSVEGRLPTRNEEKRSICVFYFTAFLAVTFSVSYILLTFFFFEFHNFKALADTYYYSMFVAGIFSFYLAIVYIRALYYLNKIFAK
jgi:hypothetical protein